VSWSDVEDAVQAAVVAASRLPDGQVVWSYQNVNEPQIPHAIINFEGPIVVGIDRLQTSTDLTRAAGQEIKVEVKGVREVVLGLEFFTPQTIGDSAARQLGSITCTRLRLPSIRPGLQQAGLGLFDPGPVNWIPDIPSAGFRGRARADIRCYVPVTDCLEYVGYIARVAGTIYPSGLVGSYGASGIPFDTG
jgi:hypothetical protein